MTALYEMVRHTFSDTFSEVNLNLQKAAVPCQQEIA